MPTLYQGWVETENRVGTGLSLIPAAGLPSHGLWHLTSLVRVGVCRYAESEWFLRHASASL